MNIGFFIVDGKNSDKGLVYAHAMVESAKQHMPRVRVVQFTDTTSQRVKGVDEVRRKPTEPMALLRMRHHAGVPGEWLFVDTDVIFQAPVTSVFKDDKDFDIGLTTREWSHLKVANGFSEKMPFNTGVVFSRKPSFWAEVYTRLRDCEPDLQQWMGDQEVIGEMATEASGRYKFAHLKGHRYNYPPSIELKADKNPMETAAIVHYKGPLRKPMLLKRIRRESRQCA